MLGKEEGRIKGTAEEAAGHHLNVDWPPVNFRLGCYKKPQATEKRES